VADNLYSADKIRTGRRPLATLLPPASAYTNEKARSLNQAFVGMTRFELATPSTPCNFLG